MTSTTKVKVKFKKKSYGKTVIDFNFGRHEDLFTLKSDIHLGLAASMNIAFQVDNSSCLPIEVNNCVVLHQNSICLLEIQEWLIDMNLANYHIFTDQLLQEKMVNIVARTSDSGNGNHSVSLPTFLVKVNLKSRSNAFIFIYKLAVVLYFMILHSISYFHECTALFFGLKLSIFVFIIKEIKHILKTLFPIILQVSAFSYFT